MLMLFGQLQTQVMSRGSGSGRNRDEIREVKILKSFICVIKEFGFHPENEYFKEGYKTRFLESK